LYKDRATYQSIWGGGGAIRYKQCNHQSSFFYITGEVHNETPFTTPGPHRPRPKPRPRPKRNNPNTDGASPNMGGTSAAGSGAGAGASGAEQNENELCIICFEFPRNIVFQCGHLCCKACAYKIEECHVCRVPIRNRIRIYDN